MTISIILILCTIIIGYLDQIPVKITILLCDLPELSFAQHSGTDTPLRIILPLQLPQPEGANDIRGPFEIECGDDVFQRVACRFAVFRDGKCVLLLFLTLVVPFLYLSTSALQFELQFLGRWSSKGKKSK